MADKLYIENAKVTDKGVELKTSGTGKEYALLTVMWSSSRKSQDGQGRDYGPTKFVQVRVFGFGAQDVVAHVKPGDRVNVSGEVEHFIWESNNGPKDDWKIPFGEVTLPVPRAQQGGNGGQFNGGGNTFNQGGQFTQQPQQNGFSTQPNQGDPWNSAPPQTHAQAQPQGGFGQQGGWQ